MKETRLNPINRPYFDRTQIETLTILEKLELFCMVDERILKHTRLQKFKGLLGIRLTGTSLTSFSIAAGARIYVLANLFLNLL
ncbi:hypothetical protein MKW98_030580 [Papaver atlanticum]|uniref:Uncharacterized protein n=1 Tax=Papaver atlanticum TaxID=357466 RepID=A0AAD4SJJ7_9MAGN|nr:hypothetical protein MKW98_030580 [Papaver atlanticum]